MATFTVHTSSSLTRLSAALAGELAKNPAPPLGRETVVVLSNGMGRWLSMELASARGVCVGLDFRFPNDTLDMFFRDVIPGIPETSPFALDTMAWRIAALLPAHLDRPGFENIAAYLGDRSDDRRLMQLARTLADTFDQYTIFRPQTILQWDKGGGSDWQALLWRALTKGCAGLHRAALLHTFRQHLSDGRLSHGTFPPRISLFGISFLPPFHLEFFSILSRYMQVDFYLLNPCGSFWGDIFSERRKAALALNPDIPAEALEYYETGNPLLSSLGTQGQEFFNMLLDMETAWNDLDDVNTFRTGSMLGTIQNDILELRDRGGISPRASVRGSDRSVQFHSCHGPLREMEVLYDNLLRMFEETPDLEPRDIVVMTPDIATYAPYITATFGTRCGGRPAIPFTIADRSTRLENPVISTFLHILALPSGRFGINSMLEILESPQVMARFDITIEERDRIREWLRDARVRWGIDGEHRSSLGFPDYGDFSWQAGLDRLLLGYALAPDGERLFNGVIPCENIEGRQALALGKLATFISAAAGLSARLSPKQTLAAWSESLAAIAAQFLIPLDGNDTSCALLYAAFQNLRDSQESSGFDQPIGLEAVRDCLAGLLEKGGESFGFLGGRVTFCAMLPMRSIPLRVVCLVGMNDGIFPRNPRTPTFSLMAGTRRRGDRSIRNEDRYLFLEAVMSAGDRFYVSYTGQSDRDNTSLPPSVVVAELMDYVRRGFAVEGTQETTPDIVTRHKLQSFSAEYFTENKDRHLFSYSTENRDALESSRTSGQSRRVFMHTPLAEDPQLWQELDLQQLIRFLHNPARVFLNLRMNMHPYDPADEAEEQEPFSLGGLDSYSLKQELTARLLGGEACGGLYAATRAKGVLPPLTAGRIAFEAALAECSDFARLVSPYLEDLLEPLPISHTVQGTLLAGVLKDIHQGRHVRWRCATMKGKDRLALWCEHLILNTLKPDGYPRESLLVCSDLTLALPPLENAPELLAGLVGLYRDGLCRPLHFFPQSSWLYLKEGISKAEERWNGTDYSLSPSEYSDPSFALCFAGHEVLDDEFTGLAERVYGPLRAVMVEKENDMKNIDLAHIETTGLHLIEASAGTGKTWTIAALYILLLLESGLRPEEILVVTYTKAATAELRERIRSRISETLELYTSGRSPGDELERILVETRATDGAMAVKLLTRALYSFDDAAIFTIHGFCQRALQDNAFESGSLFDTEMITDQGSIVDEVCEDFWRSRIMNGPEEFLELLIAAGYTPVELAKPFKGHYQDPGLTIIPTAGDPDLGPLIARCNVLFPDLQSLWRSQRDAVTGELAAANLSQTSYKPAQIQAAAGALDFWFSQGEAKDPCPGLKLFSRSAVLKGQKKGSTDPSHPFFDLCQEMLDTINQIEQAFRKKLIHRQTGLHSWMKVELTLRKRIRNLRCFDDLLLDLHTALASDGGGEQLARSLRSRYHAALIDEFQDTDPLQWQIFSRLAGLCTKPISGAGPGDEEDATQAYMTIRRGASDEVNTEIRPKAATYPLFLIGDPKQAIYSFRGADIFAYISAARAVEEEKRSTLDTNRRSVAPLVAAVNSLFESTADPFLSSDITFKPVNSGRDPAHGLIRAGLAVEQPLRFWVYPRSDQSAAVKTGEACRTIARTVAAEIARLLDGNTETIDRNGRRSLTPGDIAVLVKAHYQADLMQDALRNIGIPSVQHGSSTIFESREALDLLRILRAVNEPTRERLVREALLTGALGMSANRLAGYLGETADDHDWEQWLLRFRSLNEAARAGGVISMAEQLLGECGVRRQALAQSGGERLLTNLLHCFELLHQAEQEQGLGLEGLITWLERQIARKEENETALLRLETDANAVQLSTIHASKGLEYPVVFLPFAWDSPSGKSDQLLFHDDDGILTIDLGSDQRDLNKARAAEELAAEAARLLYVAITRAEFLCCVAWGCIGNAHSSPLFPLLHGRTISDPKAFRTSPDQAILADIRQLASAGSGLAAGVMPVDAPAPPYRPTRDHLIPFTCRSLQQAISSEWRVSSFSGLTAGVERTLQPRDYDALSGKSDTESPSDGMAAHPAGYSIFDFPRGSAAGTCLHEILQRLDFAAISETQIEQVTRSCLLASGYEEQWLPAISRMVGAVTRVPLIAETPRFNLAQLNKGAWQPELEFFLPVAHLSPERLRQAFDGLLSPTQHGLFGELLASLQFQQSRGMLHGFMDLVFEQGGRYYIIDWKSNHLGFSGSDYTHDGMTVSMAEHSYILQYHLYSLALDRHLRLHLPGYSYDAHFGGAIYVFLRGIHTEYPDQGIYRDKPSAEFIERANRLLLA